jgi:hypothetical protein
MATFEECAAAAEAVGWDIAAADVDIALDEFKEFTLARLRVLLDDHVATFEQNGARGVDLADRIDSLRIVIAVREYREANG